MVHLPWTRAVLIVGSAEWNTYKTKLALDKEVGGGASPIEKPFHV
jgi:hypothetical protein